MVQYQHAYEASARFLTTIDSILDTLINRTGIRSRSTGPMVSSDFRVTQQA